VFDGSIVVSTSAFGIVSQSCSGQVLVQAAVSCSRLTKRLDPPKNSTPLSSLGRAKHTLSSTSNLPARLFYARYPHFPLSPAVPYTCPMRFSHCFLVFWSSPPPMFPARRCPLIPPALHLPLLARSCSCSLPCSCKVVPLDDAANRRVKVARRVRERRATRVWGGRVWDDVIKTVYHSSTARLRYPSI
jgi:hypothetical protein